MSLLLVVTAREGGLDGVVADELAVDGEQRVFSRHGQEVLRAGATEKLVVRELGRVREFATAKPLYGHTARNACSR